MSKQAHNSYNKGPLGEGSHVKLKGNALNDNIAAARKALGYTQTELAGLLEVSRQTVTNWECGTSVPDAIKLAKMSDILKVSVQDLLGIHENTENEAEEGVKRNCEDNEFERTGLSNQQIANELSRFNTLYAAGMERRKQLFKKIIVLIFICLIIFFLYRCFMHKFYKIDKFEIAPLESFDD